MKKILFILITLVSISTISTAQKSRSSNSFSSSNGIRAERQIAITTNAGLKTISGIGIIGSYYATPNIAIDLGLGRGARGIRTGLRGRYLFTENNFTPIVGAGIILQTGTISDSIKVDRDIVFEGETIVEEINAYVTINPSLFGQVFTGFELMTDGGFVLGLTAGYRFALNKPIQAAVAFDGTELAINGQLEKRVNNLFGSGVSIGLNLGYAF